MQEKLYLSFLFFKINNDNANKAQAVKICKTKLKFSIIIIFSSGGGIRTYDLWDMNPASYHCSTPLYELT
tara:strand:- start:2050 stop:2259 length:210 start_codon:yes stop_codon:yes gene_type:complete